MKSNSKDTEQATLAITGMTCAACANRIEKGLGKLEGVDAANVNFAMETASVSYDPSRVGIGAMEETIRKLGYDTAMKTVDFSIEGMTCAACAARIEKGLASCRASVPRPSIWRWKRPGSNMHRARCR